MAGASFNRDGSIFPRHLSQRALNEYNNGGANVQGVGTRIVNANDSSGLDGKNWDGKQVSITVGSDTFNLWVVFKYNTNSSWAGGSPFTNVWVPCFGWDIEHSNGSTSPNSSYLYRFTPSASAADVVIEGLDYYVTREQVDVSGTNTILYCERVVSGVFSSTIQLGAAQLASGSDGDGVVYDNALKHWKVDTTRKPQIIRADSSGGPIANTVAETDLTVCTVPANLLADGDQMHGRCRMKIQNGDLINPTNMTVRARYDGNIIDSYVYGAGAPPYTGYIHIDWELYRVGSKIEFYFNWDTVNLPAGFAPSIHMNGGNLTTAFNASKVFKFTVQFAVLSALNIVNLSQSEWEYIPQV